MALTLLMAVIFIGIITYVSVSIYSVKKERSKLEDSLDRFPTIYN
ncbi:MAG: hypothetical protein ACW98D_20920 [Promethearchaeota archaeon]|jgi:hypothetical protein